MNNRSEENIPTIVLDKADVDAYKSTKQQGKAAPVSSNITLPVSQGKAKTSGVMIFMTVLIYGIVAGSAWWFYQEDIKNKALLHSSELRIADLENQLSATGEEMGESTIALKTKLEGIIKKTDTLWSEMDKLWASAWRKNQAEIKALFAQNDNQDEINAQNKIAFTTATSMIKEAQENAKIAELNLSALTEKIDSITGLKTELEKLSNQFIKLESKSSERDRSQLEVATSLNQLEMSVQALMERIERLQKANRPATTAAGSN